MRVGHISIARRYTYQLDVVRDLFGVWLVEVRFGRIGAKGRMLRFIVDDELAARRMVRERLQRRNRAPGRIGVAYRTMELWDPHGWVPTAHASAARHAPTGNEERARADQCGW